MGWGITIPAKPKAGWATTPKAAVTGSWKTLGAPVVTPNAHQFANRVGFNCTFRFDNYQGWVINHATEFAALKAAGFTWLREVIDWGAIEAVQGVYDWSKWDRIYQQASINAVSYVPALVSPPAWASTQTSGAYDYRYPPASPVTAAAFCVKVVQRYGAGGAFWVANPGLTPRPLTHFELFNEPWGWFGWYPDPNPVAFAAMALACAQAIKAQDATVKTILPADAYQTRQDASTPEFFSAVLAAQPSLMNYVDIVSCHPYVTPRFAGPYDDNDTAIAGFPTVQSRFKRLLTTRDQAYVAARRKVPVWATEIGYTTNSGQFTGMTEAQQAIDYEQTLRRAFMDWAETSWQAGVDKVFFHSYGREFSDAASVEGRYPILRADGSQKPAWTPATAYL